MSFVPRTSVLRPSQANVCRFWFVSSRSFSFVPFRILAMTFVSEPLQYRRTDPSGARAMTDMQPRSLLYSMTFRISYSTSLPSRLRVSLPCERFLNSYPSCLAASTRATSSGEGPWYDPSSSMMSEWQRHRLVKKSVMWCPSVASQPDSRFSASNPRSVAVPTLGLLLWKAMIFLELPPEWTAVSRTGGRPFITRAARARLPSKPSSALSSLSLGFSSSL
mmetsp:Transcript_3629/g.10442  ORF Transcript_3629/g.10442 Transcript_3629/m.10442 type:complete len:220 (-) Transcript_3629:675-1334(-)